MEIYKYINRKVLLKLEVVIVFRLSGTKCILHLKKSIFLEAIYKSACNFQVVVPINNRSKRIVVGPMVFVELSEGDKPSNAMFLS